MIFLQTMCVFTYLKYYKSYSYNRRESVSRFLLGKYLYFIIKWTIVMVRTCSVANNIR